MVVPVFANRAERRKIIKKGLPDNELKKMLEKEGLKATRLAVSGYSAVLALCLHDKLGFGKVRAQRFMKGIEDTFDSIEKGYVTMEDIINTVENELEIKIEKAV